LPLTTCTQEFCARPGDALLFNNLESFFDLTLMFKR